MNIDKIKSYIQQFAKERDWEQFHNPKNLAMALSVESSELVEIFQWKTAEESSEIANNEVEIQKVKEELADILCFLVRFSDVLGIDLEKCFWEKTKQNEKKYPVHLAKGNARKYTELQ